MELKDAIDLYREVLRRYSEGFSLEEVLGSLAEAVGGRCAVLFARQGTSSFMEPKLFWNLGEDEREEIRRRLIPLEWFSRYPAKRNLVVDREELAELGLECVLKNASDAVVIFPVRTHAYLRAALLVRLPQEASPPDPQSFKAAAVSVVLERLVELFNVEDRMADLRAEQVPELELGILSDFLIGKTDFVRAASLSLDLLIKMLNMEGGTVHRVRDAGGESVATLIASRGWGGMPEVIEHLFENRLLELLQGMRKSGEKELSLDAARISEHFPGVKPYFHANQVKAFLLTPIFQDDRLVGLLSLFGRNYTAMEPQDMELLVQVTHRLAAVFAGEEGEGTSRKERQTGWDFPSLVDDLVRVSAEALDAEEFLTTALHELALKLGAEMAFLYSDGEGEGEARFLWYARSAYGGERLFGRTEGLERITGNLQRMAVVSPDNPLMEDMPAAEQAMREGLTLLLVPARRGLGSLVGGFYFSRESKLTKEVIDTLQPILVLLMDLARGTEERALSEEYRRALEIMAEVEGELATCSGAERALRVLARGGRELLDCRRAAILTVGEDGRSFQGVVEGGDDEGGEVGILASKEIAEALEQGRSLYRMGGEEEEGLLPGREPLMVIPLMGKRVTLGVFVFEGKVGRGRFGELHRRLANFLAGQAVSTLESYREKEEIEEAVRESGILGRVYRRLASSSTVEEMCGGLYKELEQRIGAELLIVSLQGKTGVKNSGWMHGERLDEPVYADLVDPQGPLMGTLARTGKVIRNNLSTFLRGPGEDELAWRGVRSYIAVSIVGEGLKGLLLVGNTRGGAFGEREVSLAEKVAALLGSAVAVPLRMEALQARLHLMENMCRRQEERLQIKTDLINLAAHEIRHPLTLIMGFSEVLKDFRDSLDSRESREIVEKINKAADRLRRSVINMMEISHLESGKIAVDLEKVDLRGILNGLVEELKARSVRHTVAVDVEEGAETITADRDKLEIILFNLMDNAVKYSPPGSRIDVYARRVGKEVLVGVQDRGQGISEEALGFIFQPFRKGEGAERAPIKGMGLGLYIVNRLVEAHGGRIEVKSEHGKGSLFVVRLPQPEEGNSLSGQGLGALEA